MNLKSNVWAKPHKTEYRALGWANTLRAVICTGVLIFVATVGTTAELSGTATVEFVVQRQPSISFTGGSVTWIESEQRRMVSMPTPSEFTPTEGTLMVEFLSDAYRAEYVPGGVLRSVDAVVKHKSRPKLLFAPSDKIAFFDLEPEVVASGTEFSDQFGKCIVTEDHSWSEGETHFRRMNVNYFSNSSPLHPVQYVYTHSWTEPDRSDRQLEIQFGRDELVPTRLILTEFRPADAAGYELFETGGIPYGAIVSDQRGESAVAYPWGEVALTMSSESQTAKNWWPYLGVTGVCLMVFGFAASRRRPTFSS